MFVVALAAIAPAAAVPQTLAGIESSRTLGAARYLASRLALSRAQAAARSANVALQVTGTGSLVTVAAYRDGNGNGVRTSDIAAGIDPLVEAPARFTDRFPRVQLFVGDPDAVPTRPATLISFSPIGTATSTTLYVRGPDGSQYAVRVLGATGRTRVLRFVPGTRQWIDVL